MRPCDCVNIGHCPFREDPFMMRDREGKALYRKLTYEEQIQKGAPLGAFFGQDEKGRVVPVAVPVDGESCANYVLSKVGRRCKADRFWWRFLHPIPLGPVEDER